MLTSMALRVLVAMTFLLAACASEPEQAGPATSPSPVPAPSLLPSPSPSPTDGGCTDASVTGEFEVRIIERDFSFDPACLIVLGGQGLAVRNRGSVTHNFTVEGTDVDLDLDPGGVNRTEAIGGAVSPGTYTFFCQFHRAQGMEGEITVSAAG
jgi:plastocyanin